MSIRTAGLIFTISSFFSCTTDKVSKLESDIDSLRQEINLRNNLVLAMNDDSGFLDSLYQKNQSFQLRSTADESSHSINYLLANLRSSESQLMKTKENLDITANESLAYQMMVMALQDEVTLRDGEINIMSARMSDHQKYYQDNEKKLDDRTRELARLENIIEQMKRMDLADAYFTKAEDLEEKAKWIFFAQRKKKDNLKKALELYQKSYVLGKSEAEAKIRRLSKSFHR